MGRIGRIRRVPYRLPQLIAADPNELVFIVEGEKDADLLATLGLVSTCNSNGAGKWRGEYNKFFVCRKVVVLPDNDKPGFAHAKAVEKTLRGIAQSTTILKLPGLQKKGDDVSDWLAQGGSIEELRSLVAKNAEATDGINLLDKKAVPHDTSDDESSPRKSQATRLVELARDRCELWTGDDDQAYATHKVDTHNVTYRIRSKTMREWLSATFLDAEERAPGGGALTDGIETLAGLARRGPRHPICVRVAGNESRIVVDLCDNAWRAIVIDADGWQITDRPPVRFRRTAGMKALPEPERGGTFAELQEYVRTDESEWPLVVTWILSALRPGRPHPILALHGLQGSGKTTAARMIRDLIDPHEVPLRCAPKNDRDLMISATRSQVIALDNLSSITGGLSDALCRLSTGGGFATRKLHSDDEEAMFSAVRPILLTSITDIVSRPDLLDRTLTVTLPAIDESERERESHLWQQWFQARPQILGALLDALVCAIRCYPDASIDGSHRMIDAATWAVAAAPAVGLTREDILSSLVTTRESGWSAAIEESVIGSAVIEVMREKDHWSGTATALRDDLAAVNGIEDQAAAKRRQWPVGAKSNGSRNTTARPSLTKRWH